MNNRMKLMMMTSLLISAVLMLGYGGMCGSSSKSDSGDSGTTAPAATGIAVDPYVEGVQFFEDLDNDSIKDVGEQLSSLSDANGVFTFADLLTLGSTLTLNPSVTGTHNGVAFTGKIKRTVDTITDTLVTSPLTTLLANGWTESEVVLILSQAGLTGITTADIKSNPMAGIENLDAATLTEAHLIKIRASIAIYSFLSVMDKVITSTGITINYNAFVASPTAITLLQNMVTSINNGLSTQILTSIDTALASVNTMLVGIGQPTLPKVTAGDVIRASVAISNHIIPKVIVNLAYLPTQIEVTNWSFDLGKRFYTLRNKTHTSVQGGITYGQLTPIGTATTFIIDDSGTVINQ
ncbi:MAG: hypothetical protein WC980_10285 [Candidatus Brocadiia bacterium]